MLASWKSKLGPTAANFSSFRLSDLLSFRFYREPSLLRGGGITLREITSPSAGVSGNEGTRVKFSNERVSSLLSTFEFLQFSRKMCPMFPISGSRLSKYKIYV